MTIPRLEELKRLQQQISPSPWSFEEHAEYEHFAGLIFPSTLVGLSHEVLDADGNHLFGNSNDKVLTDYPANLLLAAHLPEIVADNIRMREELESWRSNIEFEAEHTADAQHRTSCRDVSQQITRILEGGE